MNTTPSIEKVEAEIRKALEAGPTRSEWRSSAMGGSSVVLTDEKPGRNDTRIPPYGYDERHGHSIAYPFIEDDGKTRLDFVCFSHEDAAWISACRPSNITALLEEIDRLRVDARRYQKLSSWFAAANFQPETLDLGTEGVALIFLAPEGIEVSSDLDLTIDRAALASQEK